MGKRGIRFPFVIICLLFIVLLATIVYALTEVTLNSPSANQNISGVFLLNATTNATAANVTFYFINATGGIQTNVTNTTSGTNFTISFNTSSIPDGLYNITANATNSSNTVVTTTNADVRVDNTAPSIGYANPTHLGGANVSGNITINISANDSGVGLELIQIFVNGTNVLNCSSSPCYYNNASSQGSHDFNATANDSLGNLATLSTRSVTVDSVAPNVSLVSPVANTNYRVNFTVNATVLDLTSNVDVVQYRVRNVSGAVVVAYTSLGNITGGNYSATFDVSSLVDGNYTFQVSGNDTAGNVNDSVNVSGVFIDDTAPSIGYANPTHTDGANITANLTINVSVNDTGIGIGTIQIFVNGTNVLNCSSSPCYYNNASSQGSHDFNATANDTLGNLATLATRIVTVDSAVPSVTIVSPSVLTNYRLNFTVNVTVIEGVTAVDTVQYRVRNGSGAVVVAYTSLGNITGGNYSATFDVTSLADGNYTFQVSGNDTAGNVNDSVNVSGVFIDDTAPSIGYANPTLVDGVNVSSNLTINVSVNETGVGLEVIQVFVDGSNVLNCSSSPCYYNAAASDGSHTFNATANDSLGNFAKLGTRNVTTDISEPSVTIISPTATTNYGVNFTVNATVTDATVIDTVRYRVRNASGTEVVTYTIIGNVTGGNYSATFDVTSLADGNYTFQVSANDTAGNVNDSVNVSGVFIDDTAPSIGYANPTPASGTNTTGNLTVNVSANDTLLNIGLIQVWVDGAALLNCSSSPCYYNAAALNGSHTVNATANDSVGNLATLATRTFTVDTIGPSIQLNSPVDTANFTTSTVNFNWTATDTLSTTLLCDVSVNGTLQQGNITTINGTATNFSVGSLTDGIRSWNITCRDGVQNSNISLTQTFTIDTGAPNVTINSPSNASSHKANFTLNVSAADSTTVQYRLQSATANNTYIAMTNNSGVWQATINATNAAQGNFTILINATDQLGNSNNSVGFLITVDRTAPNVSSFTLSATSVSTGDTITGDCSGVDNFDVSVSATVTGIDTTTAGTKTATCTLTDNAGNTNTSIQGYSVSASSSGGGGGGGGSGGCQTNWQCTDWGVCSGGFQTRTCEDAKKCSNRVLSSKIYGVKPDEKQSCSGATAGTAANPVQDPTAISTVTKGDGSSPTESGESSTPTAGGAGESGSAEDSSQGNLLTGQSITERLGGESPMVMFIVAIAGLAILGGVGLIGFKFYKK